MEVFSGIDLVEISRFLKLNPAIRKRFFERVFTPAELAYIDDSNERAAGIFAAKEACAKALGCGIGPVRWVDIEVSHTEEKQPQIKLHGNAIKIAEEKNISSISLSITHTKKTAGSVVTAITGK